MWISSFYSLLLLLPLSTAAGPVAHPLASNRNDGHAIELNVRSRAKVGSSCGISTACSTASAAPGHTTRSTTWEPRTTTRTTPVSELAVVLIDMWDFHPCPCALSRFRTIATAINDTITAAREQGILIIHAPSDVVGDYDGKPAKPFYKNHPAREWVTQLPNVSMPSVLIPQNKPADPLSTTHNCDCAQPQTSRTWESETDLITIHPTDALIDGNDGLSLHNIVRARGIKTLIYTGVATNMCVIHRNTATVAAKGWGLDVLLVRELTDTMYNPEDSPYLASHEAGNQLYIEFLEKDFGQAQNWTGVPTISKWDLMLADGNTAP